MALPPDFKDLLREFAAAEVHYLVVGGYAVSFHSVPRFTKDLDLWLEDSPENLERVKSALMRFGAPQSVLDAVASTRGLDVAWMGNPPMRIDFMREIPGGTFSAAWSRRSVASWDGVDVSLIGKVDLIEVKRASGREQDLIDVALLARGDPSS